MLKIWPTSAIAAPLATVPSACIVVANPRNALAGEDASDVKQRQHGHHKRQARQRRNIVPVRRDEEQNARAEKNTAKNQSENHLPASTAGLRPETPHSGESRIRLLHPEAQRHANEPEALQTRAFVSPQFHNSKSRWRLGHKQMRINCAAHVSHIRRGVRGAWIVQ